MYPFLLKKALPFALTFVFGAALSSLLFGHSAMKAETYRFTYTYDFGSRCRMRRHNLVAESRPLNIINVPDAPGYLGAGTKFVRVNVTFGADGRVQKVSILQPMVLTGVTRENVEKAARQIEFTPETVNGIPVTVEKEVEINLVAD